MHLRADAGGGMVHGWEASPFAIGFLSPDGHIVRCNEALRVLVGYTADELADMPVASYTHPDDAPETVSSFRRLLDGEIGSYRLDVRLIGRTAARSGSTATSPRPRRKREPRGPRS